MVRSSTPSRRTRTSSCRSAGPPPDGMPNPKTYPIRGGRGVRSLGWLSMAKQTSRPKWDGPEYRISVPFRGPLAFAFAWWTDYTPEDAKLEGDSYERKIRERA